MYSFHYPAEYYDEDYTKGIPERGDIAFYKKYAEQQGSPILELGCGTGRILIPIAETGIECYGLDMYRDMLGICETKVRALGLTNVRLQSASMDQFEYDQKFSMIYIPFRSFQHLLDPESQMRCLRLIRNHLKPDGLFILDVFAPNMERLGKYSNTQTTQWEKEFTRKNLETESTITRYYQARANYADQIISLEMKWEERNADGIICARKEGSFNLRYIFRYELEHLLVRCGFNPTIYGTFDEKPYDYVSGETIAVCKLA
ncbi:MAG TPA: class I SAM-dependent methyltransferase [Acidobacteriota bacterium]|nr:class I SAM-dependent methyltransferase [Acidobacteriota bacterium]